MKQELIDKKRKQLNQLLFNLAKSQLLMKTAEGKQAIYRELEDIYRGEDGERFRHYYSDIFGVLSQIDQNPDLGNTEILSQNMDIVRIEYCPVNPPGTENHADITKEVNKLYDHVNLDISRINYFRVTERKSQDGLKEVNKAMDQLRENIGGLESNIKTAHEMQREYITILGIFASIVLAFTGGIAFSTSVLENIAKADIYRLILVLCGLAFILLNLIYILTRFIREISKTEGEVIKYPRFMKIFSGLCIGMAALTFLCWMFDLPRAVALFQEWIY